jgi:hypothetical protein
VVTLLKGEGSDFRPINSTPNFVGNIDNTPLILGPKAILSFKRYSLDVVGLQQIGVATFTARNLDQQPSNNHNISLTGNKVGLMVNLCYGIL